MLHPFNHCLTKEAVSFKCLNIAVFINLLEIYRNLKYMTFNYGASNRKVNATLEL